MTQPIEHSLYWFLQTRAAVLTASQCATYDEIKQVIRKATGMGEHFGLHLSASMVTGLVTTTATAPVDVIKTHMFVGKPCSSGLFASWSRMPCLLYQLATQTWFSANAAWPSVLDTMAQCINLRCKQYAYTMALQAHQQLTVICQHECFFKL